MIKSSDITFVFQGPFYSSHNSRFSTLSAVNTVKKYFPGSTIIFSTWNYPESHSLFDKIIVGSDPGPGGKYYLDDRNFSDNVNRQVISSLNGLMHVETPYAVKARSDIYFTSSNLLDYLQTLEFSQKPYNFCDKKLITASNLSCNPSIKNTMLYHPCDWVVAGLTSDLKRYYSIDPANDDHYLYHKIDSINADYQHPIASRYASEQYILLKNVEKIPFKINLIEDCYDRSIKALEDSIKIMRSNYQLLPSWQIGFNCYKYKINYFTSICNHYTLSEFKNMSVNCEKKWTQRSIHRTINTIADSYLRPLKNMLR